MPGRPRKEPTEIVRIRVADAHKMRQMQLTMGLPCFADAVALMAQQYSITFGGDHLATRKYTLEAVEKELEVLSACMPRFAGWKGAEVKEVEPGEYTIASRLGAEVTVKDGMEVAAVLMSA